MKPKKRQVITPSRVAAWSTVFLLMVGAVVTFWLYGQSSYQPLLLIGLLQLFPATANLLLYLPILKKREADPPAPQKADAEPNGEKPRRGALLGAKLKAQARALGRWCYDLWVERRSVLVAALVFVTVLVFGIQYWQRYSVNALPGLLTYLIPVVLAVLFVLYIVLDKWCKHTAAKIEPPEGEPTEQQAAALFDKAVLNSLRGALSVSRLAMICAAAIIMLRMLGLVYWDSASGVIITLLFAYQMIFLIISLAVRLIRREMGTTPELSIPMPGLGGEDLGILSYLEKNTGITMRSLWSIRLVGKIVPFAAMAIVVLLWGSSGMVKIEATQQGALYRLGVLQEEPLEPGLHFTLPWPFDSVEVYDTKVVNQVTIGYISDESADNIWTQAHGTEEYRLILGNGNELVSINMRVEFVIEDLHTYLTGSAAPESLMQAAAYELITAKTITTDLATLLTADRVTFAEEFKAELIERTAAYQTGLGIVNVVLESIHPPVEVSEIYQEIVNSKIEAQQVIATALGAANVTVIQARSNRDATIKDAEVMKAADIAAAKAAVAALEGDNAADQEHGAAYRYYLYLNAIRKAYSNGRIILVGDGVNQGNIYIGSIGSD